MRICIDVRPTLSQSTGVGVYVLNLIRALAELDQTNEYHLFSSSWKVRYTRPAYGSNFIPHDKHWPVSILNYTWNRWQFPSIETLLGMKLDIAHSPSPLLIPSSDAHRVITVHDLYFYTHPDQTAREIKRDYADLVKKHCEQSDAIIAISDYARQRLIDVLGIAPSRIVTIRHGTDSSFAAPIAEEELARVRQKYGIDRPYFLFVGAREPRKNLPALLRAYQMLEPGTSLVIVGPPGEVRIDIAGVMETGYVPRKDLHALYRQAIALVMPSLDEGFGLPILEALQAGAPVVASLIPAFHEVANNSYLPIDANDVEAIAGGMRRIRDDQALRESLIARGLERAQRFSWADTARKTLELYQNL